MIKIAIVDDQVEYTLAIQEIVEKALEGYDIRTYLFTDPYEILNGESNIFDIYILDIEMKISGFEVAKHINPAISILIFVTSHTDLALQGYDFRPFGFVNKGKLKSKLPIVMKQAYDYFISDRFVLTYQGIQTIYRKYNIIYIYSLNNYIYVKEQELKKFRIPIRNIKEELLKSGFVQIEKNYYVNILNIREVNTRLGKIVMVNGETLDISRKGIVAITKKLQSERLHG